MTNADRELEEILDEITSRAGGRKRGGTRFFMTPTMAGREGLGAQDPTAAATSAEAEPTTVKPNPIVADGATVTKGAETAEQPTTEQTPASEGIGSPKKAASAEKRPTKKAAAKKTKVKKTKVKKAGAKKSARRTQD